MVLLTARNCMTQSPEYGAIPATSTYGTTVTQPRCYPTTRSWSLAVPATTSPSCITRPQLRGVSPARRILVAARLLYCPTERFCSLPNPAQSYMTRPQLRGASPPTPTHLGFLVQQ